MSELAFTEGSAGESRMMPRLLEFLETSRRVRRDTTLVLEFPWHGRRVDLATCTRSGTATAYELKLGNFGRVLEQAIYNRLSFDRSWAVIGNVPTVKNLELARRHGVGIIVAEPQLRVVLPAQQAPVDPALKRRLRMKLRGSIREREA